MYCHSWHDMISSLDHQHGKSTRTTKHRHHQHGQNADPEGHTIEKLEAPKSLQLSGKTYLTCKLFILYALLISRPSQPDLRRAFEGTVYKPSSNAVSGHVE